MNENRDTFNFNDNKKEFFDTNTYNISLINSLKCKYLNKVYYNYRKIILDNNVLLPNINKTNKINNKKYNFITFVPKFLYYQFNSLNNLFFLSICLSQLYDPFKVGHLISFLFPLIFILTLSLIKEIYEEIKRYIKDNELNNQQYTVIIGNKEINKAAKDIKMGDIIKLKKGDRVPADIIILHTFNTENIINVTTDQIDGETDWKVKKAITLTTNYINEKTDNNINFIGELIIEKPNDKIYEYNGKYVKNKNEYELVTYDKCVWANMKISSGSLIGIVIYVGNETKMMLNSTQTKHKSGKIETEVNSFSLMLILFLFIISILLLVCSNKLFTISGLIYFIRTIILISFIIPISLRTNIDIAKLYYMYKINNSKDIEGAVLRNTNISEELGRIEYLLSDKTGTLTKNIMIFKCFSVYGSFIESKSMDKIKSLLYNNYKKNTSNYSLGSSESKNNNSLLINNNISSKISGSIKINNIQEIDLFLKTLVLCHNVTPVMDNNIRTLQASSPDEIALVNFAEKMGYYLNKRSETEIEIKIFDDIIEQYKILNIFPFKSETKKMGIILKEVSTGRIIYFTKGADIVINPLLNSKESIFSLEQTNIMSSKGLRTLVFGYNYIDESFYNTWKDDYNYALFNNISDIKLIKKLENNLKLVGVSGVEDLLQNNVRDVVLNIQNSNIKVWMLTGDKNETAKCIAISTGFKTPTSKFYEYTDEYEQSKFLLFLKNFFLEKNNVLIIEGEMVSKIFETEMLLKEFEKIALYANSVIICRCAPKQKSQITKFIKEKLKKITCSIGDGGNDVGMIREASFGVGIEGLEGKQAALSSDLSIKKFEDIQEIILWHGRLNYLRTSNIINYTYHRGLIISYMQVIFMFMFYYNSISIFNSNLSMCYSSFFTTFPIITLLFDYDIDKNDIFRYPKLYEYVQKGKYLNIKTFLIWNFISIFQGAIFLYFYVYLFQRNYVSFITVVFTSLILIEYINLLSIINNINKLSIIIFLLSLCLYIICLLFFKKTFYFTIVDMEIIKGIAILTLLGSLPFFIITKIRKIFIPTTMDKIIKLSDKNKRKNVDLNKLML